MRNIEEALQEHKQAVLAAGYTEKQILGIFVYGSQNYGTATENSDVDTKAVIIPTMRQLAFHSVKTKELRLENDEHCVVMDIMHLINNFRKQNINFIEVLYTDYCWINPMYKMLWKMFFLQQREHIAYYDPTKCLKSICGQAIRTLKQNPYDGKQVGNGIRLKYFLHHYLLGDDYMDCIKPSEDKIAEILSIKYKDLSKQLPPNEQADKLIEWFQSLQELMADAPEVDSKKIDNLMENGALTMMKKLQENVGWG